jgi:hypothetical protein
LSRLLLVHLRLVRPTLQEKVRPNAIEREKSCRLALSPAHYCGFGIAEAEASSG